MSARAVRIRARAVRDIEDVSLYLEYESGLNTAIRFEKAVAEAITRLARFPHTGARRFLNGPVPGPFRLVSVDDFPSILVFYPVYRRTLWIVRVLHAARDITAEDVI